MILTKKMLEDYKRAEREEVRDLAAHYMKVVGNPPAPGSAFLDWLGHETFMLAPPWAAAKPMLSAVWDKSIWAVLETGRTSSSRPNIASWRRWDGWR